MEDPENVPWWDLGTGSASDFEAGGALWVFPRKREATIRLMPDMMKVKRARLCCSERRMSSLVEDVEDVRASERWRKGGCNIFHGL